MENSVLNNEELNKLIAYRLQLLLFQKRMINEATYKTMKKESDKYIATISKKIIEKEGN